METTNDKFIYDSVEDMIEDQFDIVYKYVDKNYKSPFVKRAILKILRTHHSNIKFWLNKPPLQTLPILTNKKE